MQNQNLPLLSIHRENYQVPKGEEHIVHYKAEKVLYDNNGMVRVSHPDLIKTNVKMFDDVKRNLELQGYTIEILHHPQNKYTNVILADKNEAFAAELAEKDNEIARLRAELEATKENAFGKEEAKEEIPLESEGETKRKGKTKKGE